MIKEHDRIVLTVTMPEKSLVAGDVGTVIHIHGAGVAFEVEFVDLNGETAAIATLQASQVRSVQKRELIHARQMACA